MSDARSDELALRLAAVLETIDDALITTDLQGVITSWNSAAQKLYGYAATDVIGQSILAIVPPGRVDEEQDILSRLERGESIRDLYAVRRRQDGTLVPISL